MFAVNAQIISIDIQDDERGLFPSLEIEKKKNRVLEVEVINKK